MNIAAPCPTCRQGCDCALTEPGCGHYGCWGRGPRTCQGAEAEQRRYDALLAQRRRDHTAARIRRVRLAAQHTNLLAQFAYRLPGPL